jgi:tRNA (mo5U34)-methyltransferase
MTASTEFVTHAERAVASIGSTEEALTAYPPMTWFHSFVLADGTRIDGPIKTVEVLQREFETFFAGIDFGGRSVLDIGAWDGAFSFEAKRRGAGRVLATDHWAWTHPHTRALEHFLFVRRDLGLDVEYSLLDVPELSREHLGRFDIVLFLGVLYHLREPISVLDRLASMTERLLIVETHMALTELSYPAMRFYPGAELNNDPTNWWGPNRACVEGLLKSSGFSEVDFRPHPSEPTSRGIFHASKPPSTG